ncbi:biotin--[acetyl-CoA-carboxylase] ligase [Paludibacter sp. 221]|uniref:biotin--[acetyl-CoA-carboxylase] ligase n=1 Tax=Paludibacter sp. 221 TaxID=2302939 RepID=UPI0013D5B2D6|nr:biotin--[acetyl-CoA-carboxylase] ligase [Paludibacter sp. 221]NDV46851.1 biotin--[acetyl-CoA-carboxylase] ligase [Paludibacter sp. 221]
MKDSFYIKETYSTNELLWEMLRSYDLPEGFVAYADFQTAGKGQHGNSWESENRKNLLFSILLYPHHIPLNENFLLSQSAGIGIKQELDKYVENISIKWPNDIYHNDSKITGILIENSLQGATIKESVIGIGININQTGFDNAPNPVSLKQITGKTYARKSLLKNVRENILNIYNNWTPSQIHQEYMQSLYRKDGFHPYRSGNDTFEAKITDIQPDGRLILQTKEGSRLSFYFKEVQFL